MEYGNLQGEITAAGTFSTGLVPAKISGFGYSNPVRNAQGSYTITLANPVDTASRAVTASVLRSPDVISVNEAVGTDTTVTFLTVDGEELPVDGSGISFIVVRCSIGAS